MIKITNLMKRNVINLLIETFISAIHSSELPLYIRAIGTCTCSLPHLVICKLNDVLCKGILRKLHDLPRLTLIIELLCISLSLYRCL